MNDHRTPLMFFFDMRNPTSLYSYALVTRALHFYRHYNEKQAVLKKKKKARQTLHSPLVFGCFPFHLFIFSFIFPQYGIPYSSIMFKAYPNTSYTSETAGKPTIVSHLLGIKKRRLDIFIYAVEANAVGTFSQEHIYNPNKTDQLSRLETKC